MNVVYIVGPDGDHEDLRYSLRSLANVDHERVWIVGHKPGWVVNVEHIPTVQDGSPFVNSTRNVLAACERLDRFALFNDDFFALCPTVVPNWHLGPVTVSGTNLDRVRRQRSYRSGMAATVWLLGEWGYPAPYSYEVHAPMWVNSRWMVRVLEAAAPAGIHALHKRTLYGNVVGVGGQQVDDPKIGDTARTWADGQPWVSTSDQSFDRGAVGRRIRALFPDPSRYEET